MVGDCPLYCYEDGMQWFDGYERKELDSIGWVSTVGFVFWMSLDWMQIWVYIVEAVRRGGIYILVLKPRYVSDAVVQSSLLRHFRSLIPG